jgi:hypothetical protein
MTLSRLLYLAAAAILFLAGVGVTVIPNPLVWAFFCIALGMFAVDYRFSFRRR